MGQGVISGRTIGRSGAALLARVVGADNTVLTQASLSAVSYRVRDVDAGLSGAEAPLTVANVVFNALQTGSGWDADSTGWNFRAIIPAGAFAWTPELDAGGNPKPRRFQVDVKFTPVSGEPFVVPFLLWVAPVWIGT